MPIILALIFLLGLPAQSWAVEYWVSSGEGPGFQTAGNDSNNCTSISTPCLTISGALTKMIAALGQLNGGGHFLTLRGGQYDTGAGLVVGGNTLLLSGTSDAAPFTIRAYNASSPGTGCAESPPTRGGSVCEPAVLIRSMGPGSKTLAEMQSVGGPQCGGQDCVGAPTLAECTFQSNPSSYPRECWAGGGGGGYLYLMQDRSFQVVLGGVVDLYTVNTEDTRNRVRYVVTDGVSIDARGVISAAFRDTQAYDHQLTAGSMTFKNGEWKNTALSCMSQPSVATGVDTGTYGGSPYGNTYAGVNYDYYPVLIPNGGTRTYVNPAGQVIQATYQEGARITNNMIWENFHIHHCGIPFNTLREDGVSHTVGTLAQDTEPAKFLHGWYLHAGGNTCINCEVNNSAGFGMAPDGNDNYILNSYIHDNNGGAQMSSYSMRIENSVFKNNGNTELQMLGLGGAALTDAMRHKVRNNTFIWGPRNLYGIAIQINNGFYGAIIENNIIEGYPRGIEGNPCGIVGSGPSAYCIYTDRILIRNNMIRVTTAGKEINIFGTDSTGPGNPNSTPVVKPACSTGGSLDLTTCNTYGVDPLFASTSAPNYPIQTGSFAKDHGINNNLTRDFLGNVRPIGPALDIGAFEYCTSGCTTLPTTAILSVLSQGATGVSIGYTGGTGCTPATPIITSSNSSITCDLNAPNIILTAPPSSTGGDFSSWSGGCTIIDNVARTCTVALTGGTNVVASYGLTHTLTIRTVAPDNGVFIFFGDSSGNSNPDINGQTGCTPSPSAPCVATFLNNGRIISIFAPEILAGAVNYFGGWDSGCPVPQSVPNYSVCQMQMGADRVVTANYSGSGCHIHKDLTRPPWNDVIGKTVTLCDGPIKIFANYFTDNVEIGTQNAGATGVITAGPFFFDGDSDVITVNFTSGVDGQLLTYTTLFDTVLDTAITTCSPSGTCAQNANTTSTTGTFSFSGSGGTPPITLECSLDNAAFSACTSPKTHTSLALTSHNFRVRAIDSVPTTDATPASYTWNIVATLPPSVTISSGPTQPVASVQTATFAFSPTNCGAPCQLQCHLDGATYSSCATGISYSALATGNHTFFVKAIDGVTGAQSPEVSYPWNITLSGSGTLSVGACVSIIAPGSPTALQITGTWITPGEFVGTQPSGATGIITHTDATLSPQGRTGIRVNWRTPVALGGNPKNHDADTGAAVFPAGDPDGWIQANLANVSVIPCVPTTPAGVTTKIGGGVAVKLWTGTVK